MTIYRLLPQRYQVATDPLRTERKVELAAIGLLLLLGLQLLYSGARFALVSMPDPVAPAADALWVTEVISPGQLSAAQADEILARPLFWEGRRPVQAIEVVADNKEEAASVGKLKGVTLLGVFGGGETGGVIVKVKDKRRRVMVGEEINGWELDDVQPTEVVFSAGGETRTLQLRTATIFAASPPSNPQAGSSPRSNAGASAGAPRAPAEEPGEDQLSLGGGPAR